MRANWGRGLSRQKTLWLDNPLSSMLFLSGILKFGVRYWAWIWGQPWIFDIRFGCGALISGQAMGLQYQVKRGYRCWVGVVGL